MRSQDKLAVVFVAVMAGFAGTGARLWKVRVVRNELGVR